jgi:predicted transcriptional regulator
MTKTDIILPMSRKGGDYMAMIVDRTKTHEFRRVKYPATVQRIWFYETAPVSAITYVCEMALGSARPPSTDASEAWKLPEGGVGNAEFNAYAPDFEGYDYAYAMLSCRRLRKPVTLAAMRAYGLGAPRGMVYTPATLMEAVPWEEQVLLWRAQ